jgi:5'-nucleotidase
MNILLTNDDGIGSNGFLQFAAALRERTPHRIFVLAPDGNRSGVSHALKCLHETLAITEAGTDTWSCSGNPADCTTVACAGGLQSLTGEAGLKIDAVVSGINAGANMGTDLLFSGTAAGARHAALGGIPAVAYSLDMDFVNHAPALWDPAIAFAVEHLEEFLALWRPGIFINVNMPNRPEGSRGIKQCTLSSRVYTDTAVVERTANGLEARLAWGSIDTAPEPGTDAEAVAAGYAAWSPVKIQPSVSTM